MRTLPNSPEVKLKLLPEQTEASFTEAILPQNPMTVI